MPASPDDEDARQARLGAFADADLWQEIVNARRAPPAWTQWSDGARYAVVARLVWERDGEELVETWSELSSSNLVHVEVRDPRYRLLGVWLDAADVQSR